MPTLTLNILCRLRLREAKPLERGEWAAALRESRRTRWGGRSLTRIRSGVSGRSRERWRDRNKIHPSWKLCLCQQVSRECDCIVFGVGQNEKRVQLQPFDLITLQVTMTKQTKKCVNPFQNTKLQTTVVTPIHRSWVSDESVRWSKLTLIFILVKILTDLIWAIKLWLNGHTAFRSMLKTNSSKRDDLTGKTSEGSIGSFKTQNYSLHAELWN